MYEPNVYSSYTKGDSGIATAQISRNGLIYRIIMHVKKGDQEVEKKFDIPKENCPDNFRPGKWRVSMDSKNEKVMSFRPVSGSFTFRTKSFVAGKDAEPTPKTYTNPAHPDYAPYDYFDVLLEIESPEKFSGIDVAYRLHYNFKIEVLDGKEIVAYSHGGSKYTTFLREYLTVSGAWELGPLAWKDNVLPDLQRRILHADKRFTGTMKDGFLVAGSLFKPDELEETNVPFDETDTPTPQFEETTSSAPEFDDGEADFEPEN